ncbi:MAG: hypothetical protein JRC86_06690 [Deltaproteobacteria bacterium]|nr:hypothetical protein [Deltaproteobacteria bacterium]
MTLNSQKSKNIIIMELKSPSPLLPFGISRGIDKGGCVNLHKKTSRVNLFIIPFLLIIIFCLPFPSTAKMRPMNKDIHISWTPSPPVWFRMGLIKEPPELYDVGPCPYEKEDIPWFNIALYSYEDVEGISIAKYRADDDPPLRIIIDKGLLELFPPESPFLDVHDYAYCCGDEDGLADKGGQISPANTTTAGYVAVETHAERVTRSGDAEVETPPGRGGIYWNTDGAPFIKIYFPEEITATLSEWHAKINYSNDCSNLNNHNTLGTLHISNMRVKIYPGGWTQIWVRKGKVDLSWFNRWRHQ